MWDGEWEQKITKYFAYLYNLWYERDGYHATLRCSRALALRQGLANILNLTTRKFCLTYETIEFLLFGDYGQTYASQNYIYLLESLTSWKLDNGDASVDNSLWFLQNNLTGLQGLSNGGGIQ